MDELLYHQHATLEDVHWWFVGRRRIVMRLIEQWVPLGATLLDVGCGAGGMLSQLRSTYRARGVDSSESAIAACRARGLASVSLGNAADASTWGPLPVGAVTLLDVIEHLDDDVAALRAAASATEPDGRVIVTVPAYQWLWSSHDTRNHHRRRYTLHQLLDRHRAAGLRPLQFGYFNTLLFPMALAQRILLRVGFGGDALRLPPPMINRWLGRIFAAEATVLTRMHRRFPVGLSVFCVSTPSGAPNTGPEL